ncbi:hypothetical protein ACFV0L_01180 [Streptosporangium canum]|uniref:hypothetical protein n=1 Tax=Streptosporangium canum TaxID=324952 RepID=UPI0036C453E2
MTAEAATGTSVPTRLWRPRAGRRGRAGASTAALHADTALAALSPPDGMLVPRRPNGTLPDGGSGYA